MPRKKRPEEKEEYWQYRPGFNWLLGYCEGKPVPSPDSGLPERNADRYVKDGCDLSK